MFSIRIGYIPAIIGGSYNRTLGKVLIHDWIWRRRGDASAIVSPLLLKRVNLVSTAPLRDVDADAALARQTTEANQVSM